MKVALLHELLTMRGGAERVVRILADLFPDAPIYTFLYDERALGPWFPKERVRTSTLQRFAPLSLNHHFYLSRFPSAAEAFDFSEYDLVISSSSAFAHGVITNGKPKHLCYVHSPARYLWDRTHDVLSRANPLQRLYLSRVFHRLRVWDAESAPRADKLLAASKEVQRRIELYWRLPSDVLYPPIDDSWFSSSSSLSSIPSLSSPPFVIASTLVPYKRIELAVQACTDAALPLVIAGAGPQRKKLEAIAGPTVTFVGYQDHAQLRSLFASARAVVVPGEEDFGLVPLEALACGTPVIAYGKGGVTETVEEGKTGVFFREQTSEALAAVLGTFDRSRFDPRVCKKAAERFSRTNFERALRAQIDSL